MNMQPEFEDIWNSVREFTFSERVPDYCVYAEKFFEWVSTMLYEEIDDSPDLISINQAKISLVDKYFEWRNFVPKSHRYKMSDVGHLCIFHVFEQTYTMLKLTELSLAPQKIFEPLPQPPPPPPPPPPQIAGLFLGEIDG